MKALCGTMLKETLAIFSQENHGRHEQRPIPLFDYRAS
jgi:hypothetical protein